MRALYILATCTAFVVKQGKPVNCLWNSTCTKACGAATEAQRVSNKMEYVDLSVLKPILDYGTHSMLLIFAVNELFKI